ncbi:FAD-dependent monooxygenase [Leptolyngbya sp. FACHB-541]|uniref:NAD(P)/FAD-dependent oxidoreductase n=1 Tax=Leptolyngbya sp. FACHB-541 TaxID=2692810 RepID=UPI001686372E|nr:FAD-dependent monooxygenase [Leptolyngbya sp. FACHB-541]MBD1995685.1 FAD-dependent monooxygenase [Leptolyngbya sp. FACHB-541]
MQDKTHALVIGGSIAGLLAGRALANHFDHVTILERDFYPQQPTPRQGLPQSRFPHTLMLRGQQILEQFFPGLKAELLAQGAIAVDSSQEIAYLNSVGWAARSPSDLTLLACSRDLLDWNVRRRLRSLPNVEFLEGASVTGLLANEAKTQVAGVSARIRSAFNEEQSVTASNSETTKDLYADLVVDASGKASHTPQWLSVLGYEPPQETEVNAFVGYTARVYQPSSNVDVDWKLLFIQPDPPQDQRGGAIFPIEGNRWIVSLTGGDRDYPPTNEAGFLAFARSLRSPVLFDAIRDATPLTPIYTYRSNENRLRHYDRLRHQPEQFIVVGHAACALNPTYGQGMTVAAIEADLLDQFFQEHPCQIRMSRQTRCLQKQLAKAHQDAWALSISQDDRYRKTEGKQSNVMACFMNWYSDQLQKLVVEQAEVQIAMMEVMHLLKPLNVLFQSFILGRVIKRLLYRYVARQRSKSNPLVEEGEN